MSESDSIKAIELTRMVFEHVHGNLGLLKFNIEELKPLDGAVSKKWEIICSFYETLGSTSPSKYNVLVDLNNNTVNFKKVSGIETDEKKDHGSFRIVEDTGSKDAPADKKESEE